MFMREVFGVSSFFMMFLARFTMEEPLSAPDHFHAGNRMLREGNVYGAEAAYRQAIALSPWDPAFFVNLGSTLLNGEKHGAPARHAEAVDAGRQAVAVNPQLPMSQYLLGQALLKGGHRRDGLRRLVRAAAMEPGASEVRLGLAQELQRDGRLEEAVGHLAAVQALADPASADPRQQLGNALSKLDRLEESRIWLQTAVDRRATYAACSKLVEVLLWLGDEGEARRVAREAVERHGLWGNTMQRPTMIYDPALPSKPWWSPNDFPALLAITTQFEAPELAEVLDQELRAVAKKRPGGWRHQPERIQEPGKGRWKEWKVQDDRGGPCRRVFFPRTCEELANMDGVVSLQWAEFSVLEPGSHIRPHSGPTNDRLTLHLCVSTPSGVHIRVGNTEPVEYRRGQVLLLDDSFEHEVWHRGDRDRAVLLVQFEHPSRQRLEEQRRSEL